MNEAQYRALCDACDRVLLTPDLTIERAAISWLHVVREHPVFLENYKDLFEPGKGIRVFAGRCLRLLRSRASWLRQIVRALRSKGLPWYGPGNLPRKIDFLFVSHLLNSSHAGQTNDFYFGNVPVEMAKKNHSSLIALINHSGQPARFLADSWKGNPIPRVVLSISLGIVEEIALHRRLKKESYWLRKLAKKEVKGLFQKVLVRASREALSGDARSTLRMGKQIGALVARLNPKAIVVTHEGHGWERVVFAAARHACPNVRCIGYQHAALFRLQHAIRRNLAREYNPDQILTAGSVSKTQLERASSLDGIPISILGSNRSFKGTRIGGDCSTERALHLGNPVCLVLPEGIASECHILFEFSLACAKALPEMLFLWRLHPIISHESLTSQNPTLRNLPRNIELSKVTLEEDLVRSRWTLYRGTTAVVQAVLAGSRPIYLRLPDELTIDPLYELRTWRVSVESIASFQRVIRGEQVIQPTDSDSGYMIAESYCRSFFDSQKVEALDAIITGQGNP